MSYLVLARKWRPQSFEEVVGQLHVTQTLQNAIKANRVPHALLFCGPRGVGKTTVARILAKALNCEKGPLPEPCNQCIICQEIASGTSVDVHEIDAASNRGIDEIREIRENVKYLPSRGRYKVYIIDEVHMLTKEAFNALLKTLEEPPSHVVFIFATTEPHKIPATILSRCQRFPFRRVSTRLIYERIKKIALEEKIEIKEAAIWLIARVAAGSLRDALSLLDQVISFTHPPIDIKHIQAILGIFDNSFIFEIIKAILNQDVKKVMEIIARISEEGEDLREFYYQLVSYWRNILMLKINPETSLVDLPDDELIVLKDMSNHISLSKLEQLFMMLLTEENMLRFTTQPRFVLEGLLLKMAEFSRIVPIETIIEKLAMPSFEKIKVPEVKTIEEKPLEPTFKEAILKILKRESPILAIIIENAQFSLKDSILNVSLSDAHAKLLKEEGFLKIFKKACNQVLKKDYELVIETNDSEERLIIKNQQKDFDLLKEVLKIFGGEVVRNKNEVKNEY